MFDDAKSCIAVDLLLLIYLHWKYALLKILAVEKIIERKLLTFK